jgi:hypothetical protein
MGHGSAYSEVRFNEINWADADLSTSPSKKAMRLEEVGITINSDQICHATQDRNVTICLASPSIRRPAVSRS